MKHKAYRGTGQPSALPAPVCTEAPSLSAALQGAREDVLAQLRDSFELLSSAESPAAAVLEIVDGAGLARRCGGGLQRARSGGAGLLALQWPSAHFLCPGGQATHVQSAVAHAAPQ